MGPWECLLNDYCAVCQALGGCLEGWGGQRPLPEPPMSAGLQPCPGLLCESSLARQLRGDEDKPSFLSAPRVGGFHLLLVSGGQERGWKEPWEEELGRPEPDGWPVLKFQFCCATVAKLLPLSDAVPRLQNGAQTQILPSSAVGAVAAQGLWGDYQGPASPSCSEERL